MLLQIPEFLGTPFLKIGNNFAPTNAPFFSSKRNSIAATLRCVSHLACHSIISVDSIAAVFHNKVLVAAGIAAAIGQLSKPFTSTLLYGKKFDFESGILQAGGFPSTHSSAVVASATSLALERGFSDPVFGLAVVYATLIMYDAQGVRREVGTHAKELNKVWLRTTLYSNVENIDPLFSEDQNPTNSFLSDDNRLKTSGSHIRSLENVEYDCSPLKESIGHTEIEVAAGALLGFLVSLAICTYI